MALAAATCQNGRVRRWVVTVLVAVAACGPSERPEWTIAVGRRSEGDTYSTRAWIVDADGNEAAIGDSPRLSTNEYAQYHQFMGWSLDGDGLYLRDYGAWFVTEGRFEELPCDEIPYGCFHEGDVPIILPEGRLVVPHELSSGYFPGINPPPHAYMVFVDRIAGTSEVLGEADAYGCVAAGTNGVILAVEQRYEPTEDPETGEGFDITGRPVMFREGEREVLDDPSNGNCPRLSPDGTRIAWVVSTGRSVQTIITELDGTPVRTIDRGGSSQWSSDGRWLAAFDDTSAWIVDIATGELVTAEHPDIVAVHWSPDARRLAVIGRCEGTPADGPSERSWIYDAEGLVELHQEPCGQQRFIAFTPDGEAFAHRVVEDEVPGFRVVATIGGRAGRFIEGAAWAFRPAD